MRLRSIIGPLAGLAACATATASLAADDPDWKVKGAPIEGKKDPAVDVSGVACGPAQGDAARPCLIVDDETQGAQVALVGPGRKIEAGPFLRLVCDAFEDKPVEMDAEAVAYAGGAFYVIGSHGSARSAGEQPDAEDEAKAKASLAIFRIADGVLASPQAPPSDCGWPSKDVTRGDLTPLLATGALRGSDRRLQDNGRTIEGLAVRDHTMWVGFRGPVVDDKAQVLKVSEASIFGKEPASPVLLSLDLGKDKGVDYPSGADEPPRGRGVRDLAVTTGGLLVLAGPQNDPDEDRFPEKKVPKPKCGDYAIYAWAGDATAPRWIRDLDGYGSKPKDEKKKANPFKPEGLLPLDPAGGRLLILMDGAENGGPMEVDLSTTFTCPA